MDGLGYRKAPKCHGVQGNVGVAKACDIGIIIGNEQRAYLLMRTDVIHMELAFLCTMYVIRDMLLRCHGSSTSMRLILR